MTNGDCQVMEKIGTAPNQNPNQEYTAIEDVERPVFCEDEQKEMDLSQCRQVGELYYSIAFLDSLQESSEEMFCDAERLDGKINDFFRDGRFDLKKINLLIGSVMFEMKCIQDLFQKIDISPKRKK